MSESQRDRFLKRLSTVGMGLREDIQLALGGIVHDLREAVLETGASDEDVEVMVSLHDDVEAFWRATLRSTPPLKPGEMVARLEELRRRAVGPVAGIGVQLERVLKKAEALEESKRLR